MKEQPNKYPCLAVGEDSKATQPNEGKKEKKES